MDTRSTGDRTERRTGNEPASYLGTDRRRVPARPDGPPTQALMLGAAVVLGLFAAVNVAGSLTTGNAGLNAPLLELLFQAAAAALAIVVALLCTVRWRLAGEAAAYWVGLALLAFGLVTMALTGLVPLVYDQSLGTAMWLRPASRAVTIALLAVAVASPPVDSRLRPGRLALLTAALTAGLAFVLHLFPDIARHLTSAVDASLGMPASPVGPTLVVLAWAILAVAFLVRGYRQGRSLLSWLGLMLAGFGLAELTSLLALTGAALWNAGAHLLRLVAMGVGVVGATMELQRAYNQQGRDLVTVVHAAAAAQARALAERHAGEERAHEARNALAAIEGATRTLERHRDSLDANSRSSLVSALSAEIARLQRLVSAEQIRDASTVFGLAAALSPVITAARAQGLGVMLDIPDDLTAFGSGHHTAEVVQNLVENARLYAPGSPVVVRGQQDGDRVLVHVEDRGPGVDREQREAIFRRGVRGSQAGRHLPGSGLGLFVSARLMRDQAGDLWVEDRAGGGATFVLALPTAAAGQEPAASDAGVHGRGHTDVQGSRAALDQGNQPSKVVDADPLATDARRPRHRGVG